MSQFIKNGDKKHISRLIQATKDFSGQIDSYSIPPESKGVFGSKAKITCGNTVINSDELDIEFDVAFDDDLEANEAQITVYNLSDNTINKLTYHAYITVEAGFDDDTGVIFRGYIVKTTTTHEGADKVTAIRCLDDVSERTLEEITYAAGTTASYILKDLLNRTGTPIAVFNMRRDWTYSQVCGVSTFVRNGKLYSRHIKTGDNIGFTLSEDTGLIGSPTSYEEELTAEDFKETINGWDVEMLLQHRISAGAIINLTSIEAKGQYRVRSGRHRYSNGECVTTAKLM